MSGYPYIEFFEKAALTRDPAQLFELETVVEKALSHESLYTAVQDQVKVPWPLIAAIHFRESNQSLKHHLHNGDPLSSRTIHVPRDRPTAGFPPFTWVESACDALATGIWRPAHWTLGGSLEFLERYNGLGYRNRGAFSPYLWDYTDLYAGGLFQADGIFNPTFRENRPGCAALLKTFLEKGVSFDFFSTINSHGETLH